MDNLFKNLKLDRWFNMVLVLASIVFLYSLSFEVKFLNNTAIGFGSLAFIFLSLAFNAMQTTDFKGDEGFFMLFTKTKLNLSGLALLIVAIFFFILAIFSL